MSARQDSGDERLSVQCLEKPALLMRTSTGPSAATSSAKLERTRSGSAISTTAAAARVLSAASFFGSALTVSLLSSAAMLAPSAPKCAHIVCPMPPAAPVIATTLCLKSKVRLPALLGHGGADPLEACLAQMPVIVEGDFVDASAAERRHGGNH